MPLKILIAVYTPLFTEAENQQIWEELQIEQTELTALSSGGKQIIAEHSGHNIQIDQPEIVSDAIREIADAFWERSACGIKRSKMSAYPFGTDPRSIP